MEGAEFLFSCVFFALFFLVAEVEDLGSDDSPQLSSSAQDFASGLSLHTCGCG